MAGENKPAGLARDQPLVLDATKPMGLAATMTIARSDSGTPLNRAIGIAGSQTALARLLGVSQMAVSRWSRGVSQLPPEHVLTVERETGISRHDLRPDVFGPAPASLAGMTDQLEPAR